jgi:hypothetical protein
MENQLVLVLLSWLNTGQVLVLQDRLGHGQLLSPNLALTPTLTLSLVTIVMCLVFGLLAHVAVHPCIAGSALQCSNVLRLWLMSTEARKETCPVKIEQ